MGDTKETIEAIKAVDEVMMLFASCGQKLDPIIKLFQKAMGGDTMAWIRGISDVGDLDQDDAQGCLIVALSALCQMLEQMDPAEAEALIAKIKNGKNS